MDILSVENVTKQFSTGKKALDDVTLSIPRGKVYGLLGPNGAGKTTLLRIINHITLPDSGRVMINGHTLTADDVVSIGYLPEERGLYKKMKVGEQMLFFARLKGLPKKDATVKIKEWMERLDISDWWSRKVEELSKGMAQKIQFVITVLHDPELLIFDEPFSGFDPVNARILRDEILALRDKGATVILSTHNMASVEEICNNITLINNGRNILTGNVNEIRGRHSRGKYTICYTGDDAAVADSIKSMTEACERSVMPDGVVKLDVKLADENDLRPLVALVNDKLGIVSVNRRIASMDEIFINSVKNCSHA